jgi:hypothetical protein
MKKSATLLAAVFVLSIAGTAFAHGPSGSAEPKDSSGNQTNNTQCGDGQDVNGAKVYAQSNGAEVCNDGAALPAQGRVIVGIDHHTGYPYMAIDGDRDNPDGAQGYVRGDLTGGVVCESGPNDQDATHPHPGAACVDGQPAWPGLPAPLPSLPAVPAAPPVP